MKIHSLAQFKVYTHWSAKVKLTKHMPVDVDKVHICFYRWVISERREICACRKARSWSYCYLHCSRCLGRLFPSDEKIPMGGGEIIFERLLHAMYCACPYAKHLNLFHLILKTTLESEYNPLWRREQKCRDGVAFQVHMVKKRQRQD